MITTVPPVGILIDLPFGVLMWTSVAHFLITVVMREDSDFIILRVLRSVNSATHRLINLIQPGFIITRLTPLYCALVLFVLMCATIMSLVCMVAKRKVPIVAKLLRLFSKDAIFLNFATIYLDFGGRFFWIWGRFFVIFVKKHEKMNNFAKPAPVCSPF